MKKENDLYQVDENEVFLVIRKYIVDIQDKINSIKETQNPLLLDKFYRRILNDKEGIEMMEKTADEYKEDNKLTNYIAQRALNQIYKEFLNDLNMFDNDDTAAIYNLESILENPESYYNENINNWISGFKQFEVFTLIGCRIEYDVENSYDDDDDYGWVNVPHYILTLVGRWQKYYEIELYETKSKDYYVTTCGHCKLQRVRNINITYEVKGRPTIKLTRFINKHDIRSMKSGESINLLEGEYEEGIKIDGIFEAEYDGGDYWYPQGFVEVNMDVFKEPNRRQKEKRPVWIFKGGSCTGKSYLANLIGDDYKKTVYETDKQNTLPYVLPQDIIVLGNKYKFTVDEIKESLVGDYELIIVDFSLYE